MTIDFKTIPYPDFVLGGLIDPEAFDLNNDVILAGLNETIATINKLMDSVTDGDSGADNISITPIAPFLSTKVQGAIEELVAKLRSAEGSAFVGVAPITGVTGTTIHAQLTSVKALLQTEVDRITALTARVTKNEADIGERYTKTESNARQLALQTQINTNATAIANNKTLYDAHNHDDRYMTKAQLAPYLQGGDTVVKIEVFRIVNPNLGNGTFSYTDGVGLPRTGAIASTGEQVFSLEKGEYLIGMNHIKAIINDTIHLNVASGGLVETSIRKIGVIPQPANTEITVEYFQRIGVSGEHNIVLSPTIPPPTDGNTIWFKEL